MGATANVKGADVKGGVFMVEYIADMGKLRKPLRLTYAYSLKLLRKQLVTALVFMYFYNLDKASNSIFYYR